MRIHTITICGLLLLAGATASNAGVVLTLDPVGGAISGWATKSIGWGFTFYNDTGYFALVTGSDYVSTNSPGVYSDFMATYQFVVAGPAPESTSVPGTFDPIAHTGTGRLVIAPGAIVGAHSDGVVQVVYDLYTVSPNDDSFDSITDLYSSGNVVSALASVDVTEMPSSLVPEPGGIIAGLFALALLKRR